MRDLFSRFPGWLIGVVALGAWIALLYFMFWDVL